MLICIGIIRTVLIINTERTPVGGAIFFALEVAVFTNCYTNEFP